MTIISLLALLVLWVANFSQGMWTPCVSSLALPFSLDRTSIGWSVTWAHQIHVSARICLSSLYTGIVIGQLNSGRLFGFQARRISATNQFCRDHVEPTSGCGALIPQKLAVSLSSTAVAWAIRITSIQGRNVNVPVLKNHAKRGTNFSLIKTVWFIKAFSANKCPFWWWYLPVFCTSLASRNHSNATTGLGGYRSRVQQRTLLEVLVLGTPTDTIQARE